MSTLLYLLVLLLHKPPSLSLSLSLSFSYTYYSETLGRIRITSQESYGTAIVVRWSLKSSTQLRPPLSITILEIQLSSDGRQLQRNYSITDVLDESECLGGLKVSTVYKVCIHPVYTDGVGEKEPVCADVTTRPAEDPTNSVALRSCSKPVKEVFIGSSITQSKGRGCN